MADITGNHRLDLPDAILIEGIVSTVNRDGSPHLAPMGPIVEQAFSRLRLRPFRTSTTFQNLKRTRQGVFHITDDVELLARAAVNRLDALPKLIPVPKFDGVVIADACRWYAFRIDTLDDRNERTEMIASIISRGTLRDFLGLNRAKHAVVEAAILATRLAFVRPEDVCAEIERLRPLVEKTGGRPEHRAFEFLRSYIHEQLPSLTTSRSEDELT